MRKYSKPTIWDKLDAGDRFIRNVVGKIRQEPFWIGHRMVAKSYVTIENGTFKTGGRNHFVNNGLMGWINALNNNNGTAVRSYQFTSNFGMSLGTDTTTVTTASMSALVSPIGTGIGTQPNTYTRSPSQDTSAGTATQTITATWNAGSVPADTLGEIGLFGAFQTTPSTNYGAPSQAFVSRLSSADGDFTAFTINTSVALTVTWAIQLSFS